MPMESEAMAVVYFYLGIALVLIVTIIIIFVFVWIKKIMEDTNVFVRLMIGLYEQEKRKNEREEDKFGT